MADPHRVFSLVPHPDAPGSPVQSITAQVSWAGRDRLWFQYGLEADLRSLRIPPPAIEGGRADRLWVHTCFEAFVGLGESPRYLELNFSPSGQWAAYRFAGYRQGMEQAVLEAQPRLSLRGSAGRLELEAEVRLSGLGHGESAPRGAGNAGLPLALSAVVEDEQGRLSYWALRHPPGRPDFHHPDGFSLALEFPRNPSP